MFLIGCFFMVSISSINAQEVIKNKTNCTFEVKVAYGNAGNVYDVAGFETITVAPLTQVSANVPSGFEILYAKGRPAGTGISCAFYIGNGGPCTGYSGTAVVNCSTGCNDYTADLISGFGVSLYHN